MSNQMPKFLKKKEYTLYFNGPGAFVFIVPEIWFDREHAVIEGEYVRLLGILNYTILKNPDDKIDATKIKNFKFPTVFSTKPGRIEKVKNLKLVSSRPAEDYRLLYYYDNGEDQIVVSTEVAQDIANVEEFIQIFVKTGKIPTGIPYDDLYTYFLESIDINGSSYGITAQEFGLIVSELCKDPKDISKPFRLSKAINDDMTAYQTISIKENPKLVSPFTSIISENWDEAVIYASIMDEDQIKDTPMENIMMD